LPVTLSADQARAAIGQPDDNQPNSGPNPNFRAPQNFAPRESRCHRGAEMFR
jgi:hypothetical protein